MINVSVDDFCREADCIYEDERYSVRDNGAILRHRRPGKPQRRHDDYWTFGTPDSKHGYMCLASVRVHRIVATAFHGIAPTPQHVVDHIDTNRKNNRPENLRWLTRLENVLKNPITLKRIMLSYGSLDAFLADPAKPRYGKLGRNFGWMRTVNPQEVQASLKRLNLWAKSDKTPSGGSLGEWVFKPIAAQNRAPNTFNSTSSLVMAKTPGAAQRKWHIPSEFPCCPQMMKVKTLMTYVEKLTTGAVFARNQFSKSIVVETVMNDNRQAIFVMCELHGERVTKPWSVAQITFEDGLYVHASLGTFFAKEGAEKTFCLAQGIEWTGGDCFDDYC